MRSILALLVIVSTGCGQTFDKNGCQDNFWGDNGWQCKRRNRPIGEQRDECVNTKLDHMSDADHTADWKADMVMSLYEICKKMYPSNEDS